MADTPTESGHSEPERVVREAIDQWRTGLDAAGDDAGPSLPAFILAALRAMPLDQRAEAVGMKALAGRDPHGRRHFVAWSRYQETEAESHG